MIFPAFLRTCEKNRSSAIFMIPHVYVRIRAGQASVPSRRIRESAFIDAKIQTDTLKGKSAMDVRTDRKASLKTKPENEIMLLPSLKNTCFFKENLSLKTFDAVAHPGLHPPQPQGVLKERFL